MKAITVRQPWATLIAEGAKRYETRSWFARYTGPLAIHAAKEMTADERAFADELFAEGVLRQHPSALPRGAIVAIGTLQAARSAPRLHRQLCADPAMAREVTLGDYDDGRWAWPIVNVAQFEEPIPATGHLGLWTWTPP